MYMDLLTQSDDVGNIDRTIAHLEAIEEAQTGLIDDIDLELLEESQARSMLERDAELQDALEFAPIYRDHAKTVSDQRAAIAACLR
jgi:hypothetical protein